MNPTRFRRVSLAPGIAVAIALMVVAALSGCAATPTGPDGYAYDGYRTPDEERLYQQAEAYEQTVGEGCAVGTALGALVGALACSGRDRAACAAVGALAGAGLGCGAGVWMAKTQRRHTLTEQELDAMIEDLREENANVAGLVHSATRVIAADKARIDRIDRDLAAGMITMDQARREMARVDGNRAYLEKTLGNLRRQQASWEQAADRARSQGYRWQSAAIDQEIDTLEMQIGDLEADLVTLIERREVSRVG
jgi:uncharacterized protein YcfJ